MAQCIVIGSLERASRTAEILSAAGVSSRAFAPEVINPFKLAQVCKSEKGLEVVVVFSGDLPADAEPLLQELRSSCEGTQRHVFRDASKQNTRTVRPTENELTDAGASGVTSHFPVTPEYAVSILRQLYLKGLQLGGEVVRSASLVDLIRPRHFPQELEASEVDDPEGTFGDTSHPDDGDKTSRDGGRDIATSAHRVESPVQLGSSPTAIREQQLRNPVPVSAVPKQKPQRLASARVASANPAPVPLLVHPTRSTREEKKEGAETEEWEQIIARVRKAMADATYVQVNPSEIQKMEGQPRQHFDPVALQELADSIRAVGQFQPGMIRLAPTGSSHTYEILDGERRWRAVGIAGVALYKAMLVEIDNEAAPYMIAAIANFHREGHTHLEISDAIVRLHTGLGMPVDVVGKMFKISEFWARELYGLRKLEPQIRDLLGQHIPEKKRLPITVALQVAKLETSAQAELVARYRSGEVTVKGLRHAALEIAERTGTHIRKREWREPARLAVSAQKNAIAIGRCARDLLEFVKKADTGNVLQGQRTVSTSIRLILEDARSTIASIEKLLSSS